MNDLLSETFFWGCFLVFNIVFFLPNYLLHYPHASFFPKKWRESKGFGTGVVMEDNPDMFRLSIDVSLIILAIRYFPSDSEILAVGYFSFIWVFNLYFLVFKKIYEFDPIMLNDFRLLKNGVGLLWGENKQKFSLNVLTFLILFSVLIYAFSFFTGYVSTLSPIGTTHFLSALFILAVVAALIKQGYEDFYSTNYRFLFIPFRLAQNIRDSISLFKTSKKTNWQVLDHQRKNTIQLAQRPNVYVLFVESYGSILLKEPSLKANYERDFGSFNKRLSDSSWYVKSQLSESVSLVGPSWLAYTSVLLGQRVSSNFQYEHLLNNEKFHEYDTLTKFLQNQGYRSYNLNASKPQKGVSTPLKQMEELYGIDEWILRHHIPYEGVRYGFTEGPTDQYVLNYGVEEVIKKQSEPFVLFYLSKNSHSPFIGPKAPVSNWRDLNDGNDRLEGNSFLQRPVLEDYGKAIGYQLQFLEDFIINQGDANDVFLLIGDHQPHHISDINKHGLETFVHVISKNQSFIEGFDQYEFSSGLPSIESVLKHESLYSIFIRELLKSYGPKNCVLPDFEPHGLKF